MKLKLIGLLLLTLILAVSCPSGPKTQSNNRGGRGSDRFDPTAVTEQQYTSTMEEVQAFISELNRIISTRNYQAWRARLSPEYLAKISSPEFLNDVSETPAMKTRRIVLRSAEEYFIHVVVPSRQNSRVDDIEFEGRNRVKAFTVNTNRAGEEVRLRLYDLEKVNDSWIIIN